MSSETTAPAHDAAPAAPAPRRKSALARLQFSGWAQYLLPFLLAGGAGLAGWGALVLGFATLGRGLVVIGALFGARGIFELVVIKWRLVALPEPAPKKLKGDWLDVIRARSSCRSFQARPLSEAHRYLIRDAVARETAQDCGCALVQGEVRAHYVNAPLRVWPSVNAREFLVVLGPRAYDRKAVIEAGRAMHMVVLDATKAGIATCWIGPGADHASVEAALGADFDPARDHVICVIALGYASRYWPLMNRLAGLTGLPRKPLTDLVFEDVPGLPLPLRHKAYAKIAPALEAVRRAPSSYNTQTTRLILSRDHDRLRIARFAATEGSRYYAPVALGIWAATWARATEALGITGTFRLKDAPQPLAMELVRDLDWVPAQGAERSA